MRSGRVYRWQFPAPLRLDRVPANLAQLGVPRYVPIRRVDSPLLKVEEEARRSEERFLASLGMTALDSAMGGGSREGGLKPVPTSKHSKRHPESRLG